MKRLSPVALAIAALGGGALVFWLLSDSSFLRSELAVQEGDAGVASSVDDSATPPARARLQEPPAAVDRRGPSSAPAAGQNGLRELAHEVWRAGSGAAVLSAALRLPPDHIDREEALGLLFGRCRPANFVAKAGDNPPPAGDRIPMSMEISELKAEWRRSLASWCANVGMVPPPGRENWERWGAIRLRAQTSDPEEMSRLSLELWQKVGENRSPTELRNALLLLAELGDGPFRYAEGLGGLGSEGLGIFREESDLVLIRYAAAEMYFCRISGACGPSSMMGMLTGIWRSREERDGGREAVIRSSLTPLQLRAAEEIVMAIGRYSASSVRSPGSVPAATPPPPQAPGG